ncbi:uncharacterized protein FA14DRAFT_191981 [Meira miltonrushii]|uniref:Zn(2)-C6 fungal-type domain-containing protein n=1 Tax=Meira miltonrushii TaxID=1280837 RepID=A0A316V5T1_9BASI|nr:uncharacterized protein FA14DRAFT_191981 [Meira miltonrushii]PWN32920.1 hypothetical protein FA14DRAFT_191981 [Meira miltonrushii]
MADQRMYKRSQRPTWSCTECARRKIKCDKKIPCQPCIKRNAGHLCSLDHEHSATAQTPVGPSHMNQYSPVHAQQTDPNSLSRHPSSSSTYFQPSMQPPSIASGVPSVDLYSQVQSLNATVSDLDRRLRTIEHYGRSNGMSKMSPKTSTYDHANEASPISASSSRIMHGSPTRRLAHKSTSSEGVADTALTFEYLALGRDRHRGILKQHHHNQSTQTGAASKTHENILKEPLQEPLSQRIQAALLPLKALDYVLTFAKDVIAWQHACIHVPTFQREYEMFLTLQPSDRWIWVDPLWLGLFFVIQSIAVHQMPQNDVEHICGISQRPLPEILLDAAVKCLEAGNYLSEPSLYTCQALAILCVTGHNVADSNLLSTYLAIGIKTAQMLNLHHLAGESARIEALLHSEGGEIKDNSLDWRSRIIRLEVGKRIWWSLVQQDYLAMPFCGSSMINPRHHDTPLPVNVHDDELDQGHLRLRYDESDLTLVQKLRLTAKMAQIVYTFFDQLPHRQGAGARLEDHVQPYETQLLELLPSTQPKSPFPSLKFGLALKRYINIGVSHKILVLHRAFCSLNPSPSTLQIQASQGRCVEAARQVLEHVRAINPSGRPEGQVGAMWTISYQAVAAAILIVLSHFGDKSKEAEVKGRNALHNQPVLTASRQEASDAREVLMGLSYRSTIAHRGLQLLDELVQNFEDAERQNGSLKRPSGEQPNGNQQTADGSPAKRARNEEQYAHSTTQTPSNGLNIDSLTNVNPALANLDIEWDVASVLQSMPDVSKLFDGSMGNPFGSFS